MEKSAKRYACSHFCRQKGVSEPCSSPRWNILEWEQMKDLLCRACNFQRETLLPGLQKNRNTCRLRGCISKDQSPKIGAKQSWLQSFMISCCPRSFKLSMSSSWTAVVTITGECTKFCKALHMSLGEILPPWIGEL